jgi:hypothetical protein
MHTSITKTETSSSLVTYTTINVHATVNYLEILVRIDEKGKIIYFVKKKNC